MGNTIITNIFFYIMDFTWNIPNAMIITNIGTNTAITIDFSLSSSSIGVNKTIMIAKNIPNPSINTITISMMNGINIIFIISILSYCIYQDIINNNNK